MPATSVRTEAEKKRRSSHRLERLRLWCCSRTKYRSIATVTGDLQPWAGAYYRWHDRHAVGYSLTQKYTGPGRTDHPCQHLWYVIVEQKPYSDIICNCCFEERHHTILFSPFWLDGRSDGLPFLFRTPQSRKAP